MCVGIGVCVCEGIKGVKLREFKAGMRWGLGGWAAGHVFIGVCWGVWPPGHTARARRAVSGIVVEGCGLGPSCLVLCLNIPLLNCLHVSTVDSRSNMDYMPPVTRGSTCAVAACVYALFLLLTFCRRS